MRIINKFIDSFKKIDYKEIGILYALIVFWIILFIFNDNFRNIDNFSSILRESAFVGIAAIGMTFCIITGGIDLSVGSTVALVSVVSISLAPKLGLVGTVIFVIIFGFILGLFNGFLIVKIRIPAFITTLGTYFTFRSLAYIYTDGKSIQFNEKWFTFLGNGNILGLPTSFVIFIFCTIIGTLMLRRTPLGRYILALGNSEKASYVAGIKTKAVGMITFGLVGLFTAISAILISSRLWSANPGMKEGYEFDVIAAVVLGGTSLVGGKGSVFNTFISAIFFASISNVMNIFHVDPFWQYIIKGIILLIAFSMSSIRELIGNFIVNMKKTKEA